MIVTLLIIIIILLCFIIFLMLGMTQLKIENNKLMDEWCQVMCAILKKEE